MLTSASIAGHTSNNLGRTPQGICSELLLLRGILPEQQKSFLHPDFARDTHSPWLMKGMEEAVRRIVEAIQKGEQIAVFGDYDADGVPATALLVRGFRRLGVEVMPLIPTRASGYGLTEQAVKEIIERGTQLLITVDNGTVAKAEIATLADAGIPTIVCDHHQPQEGHIAYRALAILNPKQSDCEYPFKELCGCALAWKLLAALYERMGKDMKPLKWDLDLVGLSTIADMVPLVGENRVLAWYGLVVMRKTRNVGLKSLAEVAGVKLEEVSAGSIGFRIAPRINAPSRMHQESLEDGDNAALRLLTTESSSEAYTLARYLHEQNVQRQTLLDEHVKAGATMAERFLSDLVLVVYHPEWSSGVIGLMAGRLLEQHRRPVVVLAQEGGQVKGSVRSVNGVDAVKMISAGERWLARYGGHGKAAGLTMLESEDAEFMVGEFRAALVSWLADEGHDLASLAEAQKKPADLVLSLSEVSLELADALSELEPFGIGFPSPLFASECTLRGVRSVGRTGSHLSCMLEDNGTQKKGIGFGLGNEKPEPGVPYKVFYTVSAEEWNGIRSASCQIQRIERMK